MGGFLSASVGRYDHEHAVVIVFISKCKYKSSHVLKCVLTVMLYTMCERQTDRLQQLVVMLCVSGGHPSSGVTGGNKDAPGGWNAGG